LSSNEDEISRKITTAKDGESNEKGDSILLRSGSPKCSCPSVPRDHFASHGAKRCLWQLGLPNVFHHLCQKMGFYPQGDLKDCTYSSGGK
jgi:hypothetical protein